MLLRPAMKVMVTGGAGFLGSALCRRLVGDGEEVVALDSFYTGNRDNLRDLVANAAFRLVEHDVTQPFPDFGLRFDRVYNLACPASPPHYQRDPILTLRTNVLGTLHALEIAEKHGARFLQASTSEVYGDPEIHPQHEGYRGNVSTTGPRACYDEGKRAAEALCSDFVRLGRAEVRIARIFNTYGPGMAVDDGRVISNFVTQALQGKSLSVYGDGQQTRSVCYVDDLIEGLIRLCEVAECKTPVNIGNSDEYTVLEIAKQVIASVGNEKIGIETFPFPTDDPRRRRPDLRLAAELLGYRPKVSLAEGLVPTIAYFRNQLASA